MEFRTYKTINHLQTSYKRYFSNLAFLTDATFNVLFTDILKLDSGVSIYEEITDSRKLYKILENKQH